MATGDVYRIVSFCCNSLFPHVRAVVQSFGGIKRVLTAVMRYAIKRNQRCDAARERYLGRLWVVVGEAHKH